MAEFTTVLIPQDPYFVPSAEAIDTAKLMFECIHEYAEISSSISEKPKFTDAGSGFERITCPACGESIARFAEENEEWWDNFTDELYALDCDDLAQLKTVMPCCHEEVLTTSIDFKNEAGFYKFKLEMEEMDENELPEKERLLFERVLGCKLTQIIFVDD